MYNIHQNPQWKAAYCLWRWYDITWKCYYAQQNFLTSAWNQSLLKGHITFVCAHTANAAWFFPAIIVVTSNVTQNVNVALVDYLYQGLYAFKYALRNMCYMRILIY